MHRGSPSQDPIGEQIVYTCIQHKQAFGAPKCCSPCTAAQPCPGCQDIWARVVKLVNESCGIKKTEVRRTLHENDNWERALEALGVGDECFAKLYTVPVIERSHRASTANR